MGQNLITIVGAEDTGYQMDVTFAENKGTLKIALNMLGGAINSFIAEGIEEEVQPVALRYLLSQILGVSEARVIEILEFGVEGA